MLTSHGPDKIQGVEPLNGHQMRRGSDLTRLLKKVIESKFKQEIDIAPLETTQQPIQAFMERGEEIALDAPYWMLFWPSKDSSRLGAGTEKQLRLKMYNYVLLGIRAVDPEKKPDLLAWQDLFEDIEDYLETNISLFGTVKRFGPTSINGIGIQPMQIEGGEFRYMVGNLNFSVTISDLVNKRFHRQVGRGA